MAPDLLIWLYPVLIMAAEAIITFGSPLTGMGIHALLILGLTLYGGLGQNEAVRRMTLTVVLLPLMRVLSFALPLQTLPQWAWYPAVAAPLLIAVVLLLRHLHLGRQALGLASGITPLQCMLMGGGLGIGFVMYLLLPPTQFTTTLAWNNVVLAVLLVLLGIGVTEEVLFRGLLQTLAVPVLGRWALLYGALLYAVMYIGLQSWPMLVLTFTIGLSFAYIARWSGSTVGVAGAHGLANVTGFIVMPWMQQQTSPQIIVSVYIITAASTTFAVLAVLIVLLQRFSRWYTVPTMNASPHPRAHAVGNLRRNAGLTYVDLALRTGIPARHLAEIEFGDRAMTTEYLQRILRSLELATVNHPHTTVHPHDDTLLPGMLQSNMPVVSANVRLHV